MDGKGQSNSPKPSSPTSKKALNSINGSKAQLQKQFFETQIAFKKRNMSFVGHTGFEQLVYENDQISKNYNLPACKKTQIQLYEAFKQKSRFN